MKKYLLIAMVLLFSGTCFFEAKAQSIIVKTTDGKDNTTLTSLVQNFTFAGSNLLQRNTDGTTVTFSLSPLTKIYFKSEATVQENLSLNNGYTLSFYPNPANTTIYFKNIPEYAIMVTIFRMDGKMVLQTEISSGSNSVSVSNLESGLYLLKVNNQNFKLIKL